MKAQSKEFSLVRITVVFLLTVAAFASVNGQGSPPPCVPDPANEDAVMEWNCRTVKYALSPTFGGALRQIRAMAIVQLSVSNAVNGISKEYETYLRDSSNVPPENGSLDAAAIGAAYQALYSMVNPAQRALLDA